MTLSLRTIGLNDYTVHDDDGQRIGRIRQACEHASLPWHWTCHVTLPHPPFGDAENLDQAKERFTAAWATFKDRYPPDELAKAFSEMNHAGSSDRYR